MIYVVIATALNRTEWLIRRSLCSVYMQSGIEPETVQVIIVDDNADLNEYNSIQIKIEILRKEMNLDSKAFETRVLRNERARHKSGTGAWNTGIYTAYKSDPNSFVAILDDDDEYLPNHLADCLNQVRKSDEIDAVFQELEWLWPDDKKWSFPLTMDDISPLKFYLGNPGVQGSNLFVRAKILVSIDAFDETFESTTDRDLMIRLTRYWQTKYPKSWEKKFQVLSNPGVIHHEHEKARVTTNSSKKHEGLDQFYRKFRQDFSIGDYQKSLIRATKLFHYNGNNVTDECIVLLMAMHNNALSVEKAIRSVMCQKATIRPLFLLISDDASTDESFTIVAKLAKEFPNILLIQSHFLSATSNRNALQIQAKEKFPNVILFGRLDADDTLCEEDILQRIEQLWDQQHFDVLLMANHQYLADSFTGYTNKPNEDLLDTERLLSRLKDMAEGKWEAELPSCNVIVRPEVAIPFKDYDSAEDHRNVVDYLIHQPQLRIVIKPDWIYCNYYIDKHVNASATKKETKTKARRHIYEYVRSEMASRNRKTEAEKVLTRWKPGNYEYLGAGFSGVVFHDYEWVYKVHLPISTNHFNEVDHVRFLQSNIEVFHNRIHFYALRELVQTEGIYILVYPYEKSETVNSLSREDMVSFLSEMWQMKVVCRSITKENNFVRVNGTIKLIDYEIEAYNDNIFLNTAARAFIQLDEFTHQGVSVNKLRRSTINNFTLPELAGFDGFVKEIFQRVADVSIVSNVKIPEHAESRITPIAYDGQKHPSVSLLIKACIQDSATIYQDVKFLVQQLSQPVTFARRYLLLDLYKHDNFLRQYNNSGNSKQLLEAAERLKEDGLIDELILPPSENSAIVKINERWFGIRQSFTHTEKGVPVTSQLHAFEQVNDDYILQTDVDVLMGYKDKPVDYLKDMITALKENPNALSIGFQIYQSDEISTQPIIGQDGNIAPDVRCCLIDKKRMLAARPFPNECSENGWSLPWYRALEKHQHKAGCASLRGGGVQAFYIHPQNYRKTNRWVWHTLQQSVKHGHIPEIQQGKPEVAGTMFDWCLPHRSEDLVVLVYVDELNADTLLNTLKSLLAQDLSGFGIVLINNTGSEDFCLNESSTCGIPKYRITHISFEQPVPYNEAIYKAIHYYLNHDDSFVCLMLQGDVFLYASVLSESMNRLQIYGADVLIGKEISTRTLVHTGMSQSNFLHLRQEPESLANGLAVFRKYLFDSLSHLDLKIRIPNAPAHIPSYSKIRQTHQWMDDITSISILVPVVELSNNPIRFDHFNILRTKTITTVKLEDAKAFVEKHNTKIEGSRVKGRKIFLPNTDKIELDITYDCNLKCIHCNRSCTQAPTQANMSLEQVQQFVKESIELGKKWQLINVLGGEPTLHPDFESIINCLLYDYLIPHSPETTLQVTSNGHGEQVLKKLLALPKHSNLIVDYNSFKEDRVVPYFTPFNMAPADEPDTHKHEYHKGCWVTAYCGIGLNYLGYFACGVAGGIERIMNAGMGIQRLADLDERLQQQLNTYCRLCGNFNTYAANRGDFMERAEKDQAPKIAMSESWKKLYKQYNNENN